mmetsp:Transcript_9941/g.22969  ORF Transcript_9941/g.22969 Transcript_9941/m.22969 type:complete len:244 (+) Transcript_9941:297-1028(+)
MFKFSKLLDAFGAWFQGRRQKCARVLGNDIINLRRICWMELDIVCNVKGQQEGPGIANDFNSRNSSDKDTFSSTQTESDGFHRLLGDDNLEFLRSKQLCQCPRNEKAWCIIQCTTVAQIDFDELKSGPWEGTDGDCSLLFAFMTRLLFLPLGFVAWLLFLGVFLQNVVDQRAFASIGCPHHVDLTINFTRHLSRLVEKRRYPESSLAADQANRTTHVGKGFHTHVLEFSSYPILRTMMSHFLW